jgi:hypothetical protein
MMFGERGQKRLLPIALMGNLARQTEYLDTKI